MRVAIYSTNAKGHPLTEAGASWLGRCAFTGEKRARPDYEGITQSELDECTAFSRRYAWHGTIKAPFRLKEEKTFQDLKEMLKSFCAEAAPFTIPKMVVTEWNNGSFVTYTPAEPFDALRGLEEQVVRRFEPFRAPLPTDELAGKKQPTEKLQNNLEQFGYAKIFDEFKYHRTIAGPLPEDKREAVGKAAKAHFANFDGQQMDFDHLALYVESEVPGPFVIDTIFPLTGKTLYTPSYLTEPADA